MDSPRAAAGRPVHRWRWHGLEFPISSHYSRRDAHLALVVVCPLCSSSLTVGRATTCLVDLVKRIHVTDKTEYQPATTVRIHVCRNCAEPIIRQKQEAMNALIALIAEHIAEGEAKEVARARSTPRTTFLPSKATLAPHPSPKGRWLFGATSKPGNEPVKQLADKSQTVLIQFSGRFSPTSAIDNHALHPRRQCIVNANVVEILLLCRRPDPEFYRFNGPVSGPSHEARFRCFRQSFAFPLGSVALWIVSHEADSGRFGRDQPAGKPSPCSVRAGIRSRTEAVHDIWQELLH